MNDSPVDFDAIRKNAANEGISLQQIAIFYKDLSPGEIAVMEEFCLITDRTGDSIVARFTENGDAMFPQKATGVYYLGA